MQLSSTRRFLTRDDGTPFFVHADTAWRAALHLSLDEWKFYLDDRQRRGFNTVLLHAINREDEGEENAWGEAPFERGRVFENPTSPIGIT